MVFDDDCDSYRSGGAMHILDDNGAFLGWMIEDDDYLVFCVGRILSAFRSEPDECARRLAKLMPREDHDLPE